MTAKSNQPTLSDGTLSLTLKLKQAKITKAYQAVLASSAKNVELKGFRKGKAPLPLVEASLDKSSLYSRVLELVLPPAYSQAVKAGKHRPIIEPQITPVRMEEGKDWEFTAVTAEAPEVKLSDYQTFIKKALAKATKDHKDTAKQDDWRLRAVLDAILQGVVVTPSPLLVQDEAHHALHRLESQLAPLKLSLDSYLKSIKKTRPELEKEYQQTALNNLRLEFALKAIVEDQNPEVTKEEIAKLKPAREQEPYARYLVQKQKVLDKLSSL